MDDAGQARTDRIPALLSPRDPPSRAGCGHQPSPEMLRAFDQFNRGEYWEQHETLEQLWRAETDSSIRNFYKGIIQVGVGFYHLRQGNGRGALKVLARGINYLLPFGPTCFGVDVERLTREASGIYFQVKGLGPARAGELARVALPQIHLIQEHR